MTSGCTRRSGSLSCGLSNRKNPSSPPACGGRGQGEGGGAAALESPVGHLTLPRLRRGLLPLPRKAAERGLFAALVLLAVLWTARVEAASAVEAEHGIVVSGHRLASEV